MKPSQITNETKQWSAGNIARHLSAYIAAKPDEAVPVAKWNIAMGSGDKTPSDVTDAEAVSEVGIYAAAQYLAANFNGATGQYFESWPKPNWGLKD